jgi:hypothetical protein
MPSPAFEGLELLDPTLDTTKPEDDFRNGPREISGRNNVASGAGKK